MLTEGSASLPDVALHTIAATGLSTPTHLPLEIMMAVNGTRILAVIDGSSTYTFAPTIAAGIPSSVPIASATVDSPSNLTSPSVTDIPDAGCLVDLRSDLPRHCFTPAPMATPWWEEPYISTLCWLLLSYSVMSAIMLATLIVNGIIDWKLNVSDYRHMLREGAGVS